jgi:hypothetical protein
MTLYIYRIWFITFLKVHDLFTKHFLLSSFSCYKSYKATYVPMPVWESSVQHLSELNSLTNAQLPMALLFITLDHLPQLPAYNYILFPQFKFPLIPFSKFFPLSTSATSAFPPKYNFYTVFGKWSSLDLFTTLKVLFPTKLYIFYSKICF